MLELVIKALLAYLLGSVIGSLLVGRFYGGVDIRQEGSGNAGGTNAFRSRGWKFALPVVLIDAGKGIVAVLVLAPLAWPWAADAAVQPSWFAVTCGGFAVFGHVWPAWHGFRGGKGMATYLGVLGVLSWPALVSALLVWLVVLTLSGYVSLATMVAAVAAALYLLFAVGELPLIAFGVAMAVFMIYTHRSNLLRLRDGNENRFEKAMLLRRLVRD